MLAAANDNLMFNTERRVEKIKTSCGATGSGGTGAGSTERGRYLHYMSPSHLYREREYFHSHAAMGVFGGDRDLSMDLVGQ